MPCDTIQTTTVQSELTNRDVNLLKIALESMGFTVNQKAGGFLTFYGVHKATGRSHSGTYQNGKLEEQVRGYNKPLDINAVKRSYSAQIIQKGFPGWKVTKMSSEQEQLT